MTQLPTEIATQKGELSWLKVIIVMVPLVAISVSAYASYQNHLRMKKQEKEGKQLVQRELSEIKLNLKQLLGANYRALPKNV